MIRPPYNRLGSSAIVGVALLACSKSPHGEGQGTGGQGPGNVDGSGGQTGLSASGGASDGGRSASEPPPTPKYYPVPGFDDCVHAEVEEDCQGGWCRLPSSCFVMGSPEDEWERGLNTEDQIAVTLTHAIEAQQVELTRAEWKTIAGTDAPGPETCTDAKCPVSMVSWWDAIVAADLLSQDRGLSPCYSPVECTGSLGIDLECSGVADPEKSVYECEGYRLPTRAEVEYAARAGTWSTWYSGDITAATTACHADPALDPIAWYCANAEGNVHLGSQRLPNGFGLFDLFGNVDEWTNETKVGASPGGHDPRGSTDRGSRKLRFGANFGSPPHHVRTSNLLSGERETRHEGRGFRLYRTLFEDSERSAGIVSE